MEVDTEADTEAAFLHKCWLRQRNFLLKRTPENLALLLCVLFQLKTKEEYESLPPLGYEWRAVQAGLIGWHNRRRSRRLSLVYQFPRKDSAFDVGAEGERESLGTWLFEEVFKFQGDELVTRAWAPVSLEQNQRIKRALVKPLEKQQDFLFWSPIQDVIPNVRTVDIIMDMLTWDSETARPKEIPHV